MNKFFKDLKDYFNINARARKDFSDYNFVITAAKPEKMGQKIAAYFDLHSRYRAADRVATEIMQLANKEGVTGGHFNSSKMTRYWGYCFAEKDFKIQLETDGRIFLRCDAVFAEKVKNLASVASVKEINQVKPAPDAGSPEVK